MKTIPDDLKFFKELPPPEDGEEEPNWHAAGRVRLATIISEVNRFEHAYGVTGSYQDGTPVRRVLVSIVEARQTWAAVDGGSTWRRMLDEIELHVKQRAGLIA